MEDMDQEPILKTKTVNWTYFCMWKYILTTKNQRQYYGDVIRNGAEM